MSLLFFLAVLVVGLAMDLPIVHLLLWGYVGFFAEALYKGFRVGDILMVSLRGSLRARNILLVFVLIGMLTASWRICGTIPYLVYMGMDWISLKFFVLSAFLMAVVISMLLGTAFGTTGIVGTVMMILAHLHGVDAVVTAGAVLGGAYVGDRTSPMSSAAVLVCESTGTGLYDNIGRWLKAALVPVGLSCAVYTVFFRTALQAAPEKGFLQPLLQVFTFNGWLLLPPAILIVLTLLKVRVRWSMLLSVLVAMVLGLLFQNISVTQLATALWSGYEPEGEGVLRAFAGGGITSMFKAGLIVSIASSYMGIFEITGMLRGVERVSKNLCARIGQYATTLVFGTLLSGLACNQSLSIMLTSLLCCKNYQNSQAVADDIADTTVVVSGIVPWSIACAVPLAIMQAPSTSVLFACFCYFLPLWGLVNRFADNKR